MYVYCSFEAIVASSSMCGESDGCLKVSRKSPTESSSSKQVTLEATLCRAQPRLTLAIVKGTGTSSRPLHYCGYAASICCGRRGVCLSIYRNTSGAIYPYGKTQYRGSSNS